MILARRSIASALLCLATCLPVARAIAQETQARTSLYVRSDSDKTTVITPRLSVSAPLAEQTTVDLTYSVDVWTSASIDIRTSASKAITEQRDEIDVGLAQGVGDLTLSGGYRFSTEPDYLSNGGSLGVSYDFAENNSTLALGVSAIFDDVGRAGDPGFSRPLRTTSARLSFTQVLDTKMFGQLIYEFGRSEGFLASPYRLYGIGSNDGTCAKPRPQYCLLEQVPTVRQRHAVSGNLRRAFSDAISLGASYRFYTDDWQLISHTIEADLAWLAGEQSLLRLRYRFYSQGKAKYYRKRILMIESLPRYFTHDKELATIGAHRIALDLEQRWPLDDAGDALRLIVSAGPSFYSYADFLPVSSITAFEATLSLVLEL